MKKLVAVLIVSVPGLTLTAAHAGAPRFAHDYYDQRGHQPPTPSKPLAAPEIDPSSGIAALTLLLGGLTVMRSRFGTK